MNHRGSQTHHQEESQHPVRPLHPYRCHGCVILPGSQLRKSSQAVKANDRGHHQVAVQPISQGTKKSLSTSRFSTFIETGKEE